MKNVVMVIIAAWIGFFGSHVRAEMLDNSFLGINDYTAVLYATDVGEVRITGVKGPCTKAGSFLAIAGNTRKPMCWNTVDGPIFFTYVVLYTPVEREQKLLRPRGYVKNMSFGNWVFKERPDWEAQYKANPQKFMDSL